MYFRSTLAGLPKPNQYAGGFIRLRPSYPTDPRRRQKFRNFRLPLSANAAASHRFLKPMQLAGLGKMTPEQEAQKKELKRFIKSQRKAIKQSVKGKKARKAAFQQAGVSMRDKRQIMKAFRQSAKLGVPLSPVAPSSPVLPTFPGGSGIIEPIYVPPMSTGSGGGGAGGAGYDPMTGEPLPAETGGGGILPLILGAGALYFLA